MIGRMIKGLKALFVKPKEKSAAFVVRSCEPLGQHRYRLTTYSEKYGEVTQTIVAFPKSFFERTGES